MIRDYSLASPSLTTGEYAAAILPFRIAAITVFGMLAFGLSGTVKTEWGAAGTLLAIFVPYALKSMSVVTPEYTDITSFLSGDRLYLASVRAGGSITAMIWTAAAWTLAAAALCFCSGRAFCRGG